MGTIKIGKLIYAVICLVIFISVVNCYGAKEKAEEFFEQGKKIPQLKMLITQFLIIAKLSRSILNL